MYEVYRLGFFFFFNVFDNTDLTVMCCKIANISLENAMDLKFKWSYL